MSKIYEVDLLVVTNLWSSQIGFWHLPPQYPHRTKYCRNMTEIFPIIIANEVLSQHVCQILQNISSHITILTF